MSFEHTTYDLGEVHSVPLEDQQGGNGESKARTVVARDAAAFKAPPARRDGAAIEVPWESKKRPAPDWAASLSLFVPGGTHLVRTDVPQGLCYLAVTAFLATLAWAVLATLDRLGPTLGLFELRPESPVWILGGLLLAAAAVHVTNVATAPTSPSRKSIACHPTVAGVASFVFPGWGQVLNGDRGRAVGFLVGLWVVATAWILAAAPVQSLLAAQNLYLPGPLQMLASPAVRWTLPAVLWTLAVYDAVLRARKVA